MRQERRHSHVDSPKRTRPALDASRGDADADEALRVLVRVLARQAAQEAFARAFELETDDSALEDPP